MTILPYELLIDHSVVAALSSPIVKSSSSVKLQARVKKVLAGKQVCIIPRSVRLLGEYLKGKDRIYIPALDELFTILEPNDSVYEIESRFLERLFKFNHLPEYDATLCAYAESYNRVLVTIIGHTEIAAQHLGVPIYRIK